MRLTFSKIFAALTNTKSVTLANGSTIWYSVPEGERIAVSYNINKGDGARTAGTVILKG